MTLDQTQYVHAMAEDPETGKPMQKVAATLSGSNVIQPTDIQSRYSQTIQTHNAVSILTNGWSESAWVDTSGFTEVCLTVLNDADVNSNVQFIWSHDGVNKQGVENAVMSSGSLSKRVANTVTKARYLKVSLNNSDAATHILSAWAYLKA